MVYLAAPSKGGGTEFPRLRHPGKMGRWCEFVECEGDGPSGGEGVVFKARKGGAVFWMNFDEDGRGFKETIHAGQKVLEGTKIGLNIWSWYQAGHERERLIDV
jgi:prolyl 4-hydroxylase